ncbi:MAG TPA: homoserine dehydrogenase [Deltaproteobacteria bacterium]|nr:homoserine dehydrogenase [Deltaproteobacteria bacterium]
MVGVGIVGLGTVGFDTYRILRDYRSLIETRAGVDLRVVAVADADPDRLKLIGEDPDVTTTTDAPRLIEDDRVEIVVELMGGTDAAFDYTKQAIALKKWVVTANKALLAERGEDLFGFADEQGSEIGFEASVCGGIPVIRAIRDGLVGNRIHYMLGILNGTSNYILSRMADEGIPFDKALAEAQRLGFAEKDPTLDIEGIDAAHKLCILVRLALGFPMQMSEIATAGISKIEPIDIEFAKEFGYRIKLLGVAKEEENLIEARVEPAMIPIKHPMSNVNEAYNAVYLVGDNVGSNLYYGKGAGGSPTGSAVVSDIVDMALRKTVGCSRRSPIARKDGRSAKSAEKSMSPFYMRFKAQDTPGVLSRISGVLANYNISIYAVVQKGRKVDGYVPIVMLTYEASEGSLRKAKAEIDRLPFIGEETMHIRIEDREL